MAVPIVHHPAYTVPLPHRRGFPMGKYGQLIQLLRDRGLATTQTTHEPDIAPRWWLELAHDSDYVDAILSQTAAEAVMRRIGLPLSELPSLKTKSRSKRRHYSTYYDDRTRELVAKMYHRHIEHFGYRFEER